MKARKHLEDLSTDQGVIKMDLKEIVREGVEWINLTPDRDKWRNLASPCLSVHRPAGYNLEKT